MKALHPFCTACLPCELFRRLLSVFTAKAVIYNCLFKDSLLFIQTKSNSLKKIHQGDIRILKCLPQ